jgi:radical SAM-linked protein
LRITFSKSGPLTYTSHLDLMRVWERALRRAGLPLAYSGGFNPRAKLQLAAALPLGHTGEAEVLDVWLEAGAGERGRGGEEGVAEALAAVLPDGLQVRQVRRVDEKEPALPTQVTAAEYLVTVEWGEPADEVEARIERLLAAAELPQERRGRRYDLRPLIERLWLEWAGEGKIVLGMQLAAREGATARPEAVLEVLGMGGAFARFHRLRLLTVECSRL